MEETGRDPQAVSGFVERFAAELTEAGIPRMPARVFSALLADDDGVLTSVELADRLQVSPAAISTAVRYLAQVRLISREREPGSRRERYRVHQNTWFEAITQRDQLLYRWTRVLQEGTEALGPGTPAGQRIADSVRFFQFMVSELHDLLDRWKEYERRMESGEDAGSPGSAEDTGGAEDARAG